MGSLGSNKEINADNYTGIRKPLRILWINSAGGLNLTSRGKYRRIYGFAKKHQVHLIARRRMSISPDLDSQLCELRKIPELLIPIYSAAKLLASFFLNRRFDVVYTNPDISLLVGFFAKLLLGRRIKWVIDLYDEPLPGEVGKRISFRYVKYLIYRFFLFRLYALKNINLGLTIGKDTNGGLPLILINEYAISRDKLLILPNGTDLNLFRALDRNKFFRPEPFRILFVGEMKPDVGLYDLLQAYSYVLKWRADVDLVLVGPSNDEEREKLETEISRFGLGAKVNYLGEVPSEELPDIYSRCDIGIYPFRKRRALDCVFPLKVYEYLAMGMPVVATRLYGVSQIVRDHVNGLLVAPEEPLELAEAIHELVSNRKLYNRLQKNTRASVLGNDWGVLVDQWMKSVEALFNKSETGQ